MEERNKFNEVIEGYDSLRYFVVYDFFYVLLAKISIHREFAI